MAQPPATHLEHKQQAPSSVACAVITVSDTRTPDTDQSGQLMQELLGQAGHSVAFYQIVKDEPEQILALLEQVAASGRCQAILLNGGTGIARRDTTFDAVDRLLEKRLVGFGELFRYLSYLDIGPAAMLSRATAGVYRGHFLACTPGSPAAVRLAMEKLLLPELGHIIRELNK